jgi:hypothetical protein
LSLFIPLGRCTITPKLHHQRWSGVIPRLARMLCETLSGLDQEIGGATYAGSPASFSASLKGAASDG